MEEWFVISSSAAESYVWSSATQTVHHTLKQNAPGVNGQLVVGGTQLLSAQNTKAAIHVWKLGGAESPWQRCAVPERLGPLAASLDGAYLFGGGQSGDGADASASTPSLTRTRRQTHPKHTALPNTTTPPRARDTNIAPYTAHITRTSYIHHVRTLTRDSRAPLCLGARQWRAYRQCGSSLS
jgi:hypothetical protein